MSSLFNSTMNTRILPAGAGKYIRSDAPVFLADDEILWLREHHVSTVIDLREVSEKAGRPCILETLEGFGYYHLPVTGGGGTPKSLDHLYEVYVRMLDDQMNRIIDTAMNAKENVLYFCTAGKDRTGVVSAVILRKLGCSDEVIIGDYMKSKDNLAGMLTEYAVSHPEVDIEIITPHEENIRRVLEKLDHDRQAGT